MKILSIDIETYSSAPLQKFGVYRYLEVDNCEILLFGYSVNSGSVQVVDLDCGEQISKEVLLALEEDDVIKWAAFKNYNLRDVETEMGIQQRPANKAVAGRQRRCESTSEKGSTRTG